MDQNTVITFITSRKIKRLSVVLAVIILFVSGLVVVKPEPFLRFGYTGVFIFTAIGGGSLVVFPLSVHMDIYLLALAAASGMAINVSIAWIIGKSGRTVFEQSTKVKRIETTIRQYGPYAIFAWSLLPFPYDLVGLVAGYLGINYPTYVIPTFLGKFLRFVLIGLSMAIYR